jgi:hypothetical protein
MNANGNLTKMKIWHKCLLASLGALLPLIMSLYYTEWSVLAQNFTLGIFIGYCIKVIILVFLGGLIGYLYKSETNRWKILQLGIAAPSIMLGLINEQDLVTVSGGVPNNNASFWNISPPTNYMAVEYYDVQQESSVDFQDIEVMQYGFPEETVKNELLRGLTGKKITNSWFLLYDSFLELQEARHTTSLLQNQYPDVRIQLYQSFRDPEKYDVVIGTHLEYEEGLKLQKEYRGLMEKNLELLEYNPSLFEK